LSRFRCACIFGSVTSYRDVTWPSTVAAGDRWLPRVGPNLLSIHLTPVIAATVRWLITAYPAPPGALGVTLAETQARQATTVAAWLRYSTTMDAALVHLVGPGGSERLDWLVGADVPALTEDGAPWRTWVDESVASWAACLLGDVRLAAVAVAALPTTEHASGLRVEFRRLLEPDDQDRRAAVLLRNPDFLAPVADLHRPQLLQRLDAIRAA
jgi:hypothetical protein